MFGVGHAAPEQEFNMILTVTMNPSIDTRYQLDKLVIDDVNRVTPEKTAGGKGLNVARVLGQLGDDVVATGLLGGHMGAYMAELMDADGVKNDFVPIAGETRICLNILHEGNQTELLESGPQIVPAELEAFTAKFAELAAKADVVTLSGSLPRGVDAGYYAELVKIAEEAGAKVLLDTSGASLEAALESDAKPELVKPNLTEINGLLGTSFTTDDVDALREALAADDRFAGMEVKGVFYTEKAEAGKAIIEACKEMNSPDPVPLGAYRGFTTELLFDTVERQYVVRLKGETSRNVPLGEDIHGNITRIDNGIERFEEMLKGAENDLENTEKQFETAKAEAEKPFSKEEELKSKMARLDELNILLNLDKNENEIVGGEPDEGEAQPEKRERDYER